MLLEQRYHKQADKEYVGFETLWTFWHNDIKLSKNHPIEVSRKEQTT